MRKGTQVETISVKKREGEGKDKNRGGTEKEMKNSDRRLVERKREKKIRRQEKWK